MRGEDQSLLNPRDRSSCIQREAAGNDPSPLAAPTEMVDHSLISDGLIYDPRRIAAQVDCGSFLDAAFALF